MNPSREGRVRMTNIRNPLIVKRYYYWYYVKMRRDALSIMQNREFFLHEITMERIILSLNDMLNDYINSQKKAVIKEFKEEYRSFDWTCTKDELINN